MNQLVSVVVPIYKVEPYLRKCVDSLLAQDYDNLEIVLVDDGSPDRCPQIADEYAEKYENVMVLHKQNGGLGDARNYGVRHAKGEWIAFVDSDDYVSPTYISDLVVLRAKLNADMAVTRIRREHEGDLPAKDHLFEDYSVDSKTATSLVYQNTIVGWAAYGKLYHKNTLLDNPFPAGYYEDCAIMYRIIKECPVVAIGDYINNYHYIVRSGSILQSKLKPEHYRIFDICKEFEEYMKAYNETDTITPIMFYRTAVVQMLRCQKMSFREYSMIYNLNKSYFRKNLWHILKNDTIGRNAKVYYFALCLHPIVLKMLIFLLEYRDKHSCPQID